LAEITLTDELVENIGGLSAPEAGVCMYEHVSIRTLHGVRFLVGHGRPAGIFGPEYGAWDPDRGGLFRPVDSPLSTLFSLLDLVHEPISWEALDSCVSPERAVQWCLDHGLPESERCYDNRLWSEGDWSPDDRACLPLEIFQKQVLTLFLCFHCWRILVGEQWDQLDAVLIALSDTKGPERIQGAPLEWRQHYAQWYLLSHIMTQRVERIRPTYSWPLGDDGPNGTPGIRLVASSLFDYAFFQLAQLTMKPKLEIKRKLKLCRGCSRFFWGHGNRRYCERPGCDRRTIWSQNHRHPGEGLQQTSRRGAPIYVHQRRIDG
jgi:hypothetical protein